MKNDKKEKEMFKKGFSKELGHKWTTKANKKLQTLQCYLFSDGLAVDIVVNVDNVDGTAVLDNDYTRMNSFYKVKFPF